MNEQKTLVRMRENLSFFDSNAVIGQPICSAKSGNLKSYLNAKELIVKMDYIGINSALVSHWEAIKGHPSIGNKKLIEEVKDNHRLYPCWILLPHYTREFPEPKELVKEMKENNVRAVTLYPNIHNFSLEKWSVGTLFESLEEAGILVIINSDSNNIYSLCSKYSKLNFVTWVEMRKLYPLLERFNNLYVRMEGYPQPNMIEDISRHFGAERLIFGTQHREPANWTSGASVTMLSYADITEEEKELIAGGNLRRLLGISSTPSTKFSFSSEIQRLSYAGEKLPTPIIDAHCHLGLCFDYKPGARIESTLKMLEKHGVSKLCVNSMSACWGGNHYQGNNYIASLCKKYPERFIGFAVINPNFDNPEDEIKRCIEELGLKGIKIHPRTHQCEIADKRYKSVWEASEKYRIPILAHTGEGQFGSSPTAFEKISMDYSEGTFILGHSGDCLAGLRICIDIAKKRDNVYLETSDVAFGYDGMLEYTVSQIGAEKILFGSDFNWIDFNYALGMITCAHITDEDKAKILGLNMAKIMKIKIQNGG